MPDSIQDTPNTNTDRERLTPKGTVHRDDFVERGVGLSYSGGTLTVGSGVLHVTTDSTYYYVELDARTLSPPASSTTTIWYDVGNEAVVADGSTPSEPRLQLGTVDTSAGTTTEASRSPSITRGLVETEQEPTTPSNDTTLSLA